MSIIKSVFKNSSSTCSKQNHHGLSTSLGIPRYVYYKCVAFLTSQICQSFAGSRCISCKTKSCPRPLQRWKAVEREACTMLRKSVSRSRPHLREGRGLWKKQRNPCGINLEGRNTQSVNSVNFVVFYIKMNAGNLLRPIIPGESYFRGSKRRHQRFLLAGDG